MDLLLLDIRDAAEGLRLHLFLDQKRPSTTLDEKTTQTGQTETD
jgi:hypothetical protein